MELILDSQIKNDTRHTTHNVICTLKQFKNERYTRIRSQELQQISTSQFASEVQKALSVSELKRRSYIDSQAMGKKFEITLHAIDRLSTLYLHKFINEYNGVDGISSWCNRLVKEALALNEQYLEQQEFSVKHEGITFCFRESDYVDDTLVLTTIG